MDKRILLKILALCFVYSVSVEAKKSIDDYCWREYDGEVPADALVAGEQHKNHKAIFIGQTLYENKLIAGKLYDGDDKLYFEYFSVEYSKKNSVKILCTQHPSKFEWFPTRNTEVRRLTNKVLITGGFEPNCTMYLGRTRTDEGITPGKVMCCDGAADCYGLYTTYDGTGTLHGEFEILTYNENREDTNVGVGIIPGKCKTLTINLFN